MGNMLIWGWLAFAAILFIAEAVSANMVTIWFGVAALVALIPAYFQVSFGIQLLVFALAAGVLLLSTRKIVKKVMPRSATLTNTAALVGTEGIVTEEIDNRTGGGRVDVSGISWWAMSSSGDIITKGSTVLIQRIEGAKIIVAEQIVVSIR